MVTITLDLLKRLGARKDLLDFVERNGLEGVDRSWIVGSFMGLPNFVDERLQAKLVHDARGNIVSFNYRRHQAGGFLHRYAMKFAEGSPAGWTCEYDERDNPVRETHMGTLVFERTFDERGRVLSMTDPEGNTTRWEYPDERQAKRTGHSGVVSTLLYDEHGSLVQAASWINCSWDYTYDSRGNKLSMTTTTGLDFRWVYERDDQDRLVRVLENGREMMRIDWPA